MAHTAEMRPVDSFFWGTRQLQFPSLRWGGFVASSQYTWFRLLPRFKLNNRLGKKTAPSRVLKTLFICLPKEMAHTCRLHRHFLRSGVRSMHHPRFLTEQATKIPRITTNYRHANANANANLIINWHESAYCCGFSAPPTSRAL